MQWQDTIEKARTELDAGNVAEAAGTLELALALVEQDGFKLAVTQFNRALVADALNSSQAGDLFQEALTLIEKLLPDQFEQYGLFLTAAAGHFLKRQRYAEAEPLLAKQVDLTAFMFGRHPYTAHVLFEHAQALVKLSRHAEALQALSGALDVFHATIGPDDPRIAPVHSELSNCYIKLKDNENAQRHLRKAMELNQLARQRTRNSRKADDDQEE